MTRRSCLSTIAAWFTPKPTATLAAASPEDWRKYDTIVVAGFDPSASTRDVTGVAIGPVAYQNMRFHPHAFALISPRTDAFDPIQNPQKTTQTFKP